MSTNNTIRLHEINIPALNSVGYADGLYSALTAIEDNQSILANSDLWRGDRGDSVEIEKIELSQTPELLESLKTAIKNGTEPKPINNVNWDDLLYDVNGNPNTHIYIINKTEVVNGREVKTPMSSLYYTFVDGRFVNNRVGNLTSADFGEESDLSCILVYEDGEFKRLNNVFPTMYFENGYGLCWMVNGQKTGLPVQGVPGKDGRNSDILIVRVKDNAVDENGKGIVEESWTKMGSWTTIENKSDMDGYSCFALAPTEDGATAFYAGKLVYNGTELYVICNPQLSLQQTFDTQVFVNAMQNISIKNNPDIITTPPGLFVPMKTLGDLTRDGNGNVIEDQPIHLMTATSINNEQGNVEDLMTDMVVTPVNTTDLVIDDTHNVKVDKYLYVKMSDELIDTLNLGVDDSLVKDIILKYKLSNIVLTKNIQKPYTTDEYVLFQKDNSFNEAGQIVMDNIVSYDDYNDMIPDDFLSNIDKGIGFFQWELDLTSDTFDPDNTIGKIPVAGKYAFLKGLKVLIPSWIPHIYTKTMTPGLGDDILWFNGVFVDCEDFYAEYGESVPSTATYDLTRGVGDVVLSGYVYDNTGKPVPNATVVIEETLSVPYKHVTTTDETGYYYFVPILQYDENNLYTTVFPQWHVIVEDVDKQSGRVLIDGRTRIDFILSDGQYVSFTVDNTVDYSRFITGYVYDEDGNPFPNVNIALFQNNYGQVTGSPGFITTTAEDGSYAVNITGSPDSLIPIILNSWIMFSANNASIISPILVSNRHVINVIQSGTLFVEYNETPSNKPNGTPDTPDTPDTDVVYKLLRGVDRQSLIFDKFIPMYVNSYRMDRDTSYNLNYNVNIMGDDKNPKRTLSVFGDINCENINVYELTATGEIKNIYTKDEIVGDRGINLAKGSFSVNDIGDVNCNNITVNNIDSDDVETKTLSSKSLVIKQVDTNANGNITKETENIKVATIDNDHHIDIDINGVADINIVGIPNKTSKVDADIPILLDTDCGVFISNKKNLVGYKGNVISGGTNASGNITSKVKYYANQCVDAAKKSSNVKYTIYNDKATYCGDRKTTLSSMQSEAGNTYIQVCNPSGYVNSYTFDGTSDYGTTKPIAHNTTITTDLLSTIKSQACCKFVVGNEVKDTTAVNFELNFSNPFLFAVSMNTSCSNGKWTRLKTANSKVVFRVIVTGYDTAISKNKVWEPATIECTFANSEFSWNGYEQTLRSGSSRWREYVRTFIFAVKPSGKTFSGNYAGVENLEIYIVPTVSMRFECEGSKNLIDYIGCSQFVSKSGYSVSNRDKIYALDISNNPDNIIFTSTKLTSTQKMYTSLSYEFTDVADAFQATCLDKAGLIVTDYYGHDVMGIGKTDSGFGITYFERGSCSAQAPQPSEFKTISLSALSGLVSSLAASYNL